MERSELFHLGWDEGWERSWMASNSQFSGQKGRILRVERGECDVGIGEGGTVRAVSDSQRSQDLVAPVTGDWVSVSPEPDDDRWKIEHILDRRTALVRRDPGERETEQPLSANVDLGFLVHGFDRPFRAGKLERFLVLVWNSGATPVVVLTKADLAKAEEIDELRQVVSAVAPDVEVVVTSSESGEGLERIYELLSPNKSGTLLGESGAGKSTLVNALMQEAVQETNEVRRGDAKGRHTTITRDLLILPSGGILIDTPGVRAVGLWDSQDALRRVFDDIIARSQDCRFNDCAHGGEPGCAVRAAVEDGTLDHRRLERFNAMAEELAEIERRLVERERSEGSRRGKRRRR